MQCTLHQLLVFAKVVQFKSITKASEDLHMTQPAVSIQLKNFQDQFDMPLTEIIGRQLYITDLGMEVFKTAKLVINEVESINHKTIAFKGNLNGRLTISVESTGKYVMPFFLADFKKTNESIDLIIDVTNKSNVINSLQNNETEFALVSVLPRGLKVNNEVLLENELYVIGNKFEKKINTPITKNELNKMSLIFREEGSGTRFCTEQYFKNHNIHARKKMELSSNEAIKQAIIAGLGNSIIPLIGIRNELLNGDLKIIPTVGFPIKSKWNLIWLKEKKLSPVADAYIQYIRKNKEIILKEHFSWIVKIQNKK